MAQTWICVVFWIVIEFEIGKVGDYTVKSKLCKSCKQWVKADQCSPENLEWKDAAYEENYSGSAGSMEPQGI